MRLRLRILLERKQTGSERSKKKGQNENLN